MLLAAVAGALSSAPPPLSASAASGGVIDENVSNGAATLSGSSSITASGGQPPYSYAWSRVSGDAQVTATAPSSAATGWASNGNDQTGAAIFKCRVTDAASAFVDVTGFSITATHGTPP